MYFDKCKTLDEARKEYLVLCKKHHPDKGGSTEVMQAINAEWDKQRYRFSSSTSGKKYADDMSDAFNYAFGGRVNKTSFRPLWEEMRKQQEYFKKAHEAQAARMAETLRKQKLAKEARIRKMIDKEMETYKILSHGELLEVMRSVLTDLYTLKGY